MNRMMTFQASTRLVFGEGVLKHTGELAQNANLRRLLIITDGGILSTGMIDQITESLQDAGIEWSIFAEVESDPGKETVFNAAGKFRLDGCDSIIAVGGGSPMDCAKAAGVLITNPASLDDYFGIGKVVTPPPTLFAVPTTAGTGSEVTTFAVISDNDRRKKMVIGSQLIAPHTAILDPQVIASLPARLVASTGMDALAHAIESAISVFATPFSDSLAMEAVHLVAHSIIPAVCDQDTQARANLLYASTLAGLAFSNARTGLVHGMAHPVGSYHHVHHGLAIAILLPYVLDFNLPACADKLARISAALGGPARAEHAVDIVRQLNSAVGIPPNLSAVGVTAEYLDAMAKDAYESGNAQVVNPRKPTLAEVFDLYQRAL